MSAACRSGAAVTLALLLLAGCSGAPTSDVTPPAPTTSPTVPTPSIAPTPTPTSSPSATPTPTPSATERTIDVFFSNDRRGDPCEDVFAVTRTVPGIAPLRGALEALLAGPTSAERANGYGGWFSPETADLLAGVRIDGARALVSFRATLPAVIPNASSSCGSTALLAALDATVTQFGEVDEGWYDLEGDRAAFYGWLQYAAPDDEPVPPPAPEPTSSPTSAPDPAPAPPVHDVVEWTTLPPSEGHVVALTFDAGANGDAVASILATLESTGVPGTFFLTGRWVTAYPQLASAIGTRHAVGNHSQSHPDLTTLDDDSVRDEVVSAQGAIVAVTGDDPRPWFRFPYGARDQRTVALVGDLGYRSVRWTVDTLGWQGTSGGITSAMVVDRVTASLEPGAVVLMHVGSNPVDGSILDADALPVVIERIRAAGYTLVDLDAIPPG